MAKNERPDGPPTFNVPNFVLDEDSRRSGGFGFVFKAREVTPPGGPLFAVKILFASPFMSGEKARERFVGEINALRSVEHKAIARYVMAGVTDDAHQAPFLVMYHVNGGTLRELASTMSVDDKVQAVVDVLSVLGVLHNQSIYHRDVKPSNVMWREEDRQAVLVDFGLAWLARDQHEGAPLTTGPLGTPGYVPPEVEEGDYAKSRSPRFDIYSTAVTLYELLAQRLPIADRRYRPLREIAPDLAGLDPILEKALATESDRYASTSTFLDGLTAWQGRFRARLASPRSPLLESVRATLFKKEAAETAAAEVQARRQRRINEQLDDFDAWIVRAAKEAFSEFVEGFRDIRPMLAFADTERMPRQAGFDALCAVVDGSLKDAALHFARAHPTQVRERLGNRAWFLTWPQKKGTPPDPRREHPPLADICWVISSAKAVVCAGFGLVIRHNVELQLFARPLQFPSTEPARVTGPTEIKDYVTRALSAHFLNV